MNDFVGRLAALDTCAVSDALDGLGLDGVAFGLRSLSVQQKIAGQAITVSLIPADGRKAARHLGTAAVEAGGQGDIIVVSHGGRTEVAGWGGILSLAAKRNGVEGVVVDGACRDVDEAREMALPIFARTGVPRTARGRVIEDSWNEPVEIRGITVSPGDYLIADGSGVVFIPQGQIEQVLAAAEKVAGKERLMANAVRDGRPVSEVMGTNYEDMLNDL